METLMDKAIKIDFGNNVIVSSVCTDHTLYKMISESGEGAMRLYHVFPGVDLIYNDFHMDYCVSKFKADLPLIGIDFCREGRIEWEMSDGSFLYLKEGDLQISSKRDHSRSFGFPVSHYHGITIGIYPDHVDAATKTLFESMNISIEDIYKRFCDTDKPFVYQSEDIIKYLFDGLYAINYSSAFHFNTHGNCPADNNVIKSSLSIKSQNPVSFFQIKIMELLVILNSLEHQSQEHSSYFPKNQVKIIKEIAALITSEPDRHYTIQNLSEKFNIAPTTLKICFKGVYGSPIGQYLKKYRISLAAKLLRDTDESIACISGKVGYDNQSKFAAAFRAVMNLSPKEYRKSVVFLD